jgi:hypothetical protein
MTIKLFPIGQAFFQQVSSSLDSRTVGAMSSLDERKTALFGTSLSYLYQISTCSPSCRGGDHILEALSGRCFNHSVGSLRLISDYLYDESLNLTRSIAEITNLMFLFNESSVQMEKWKLADRSTRMKNFSPAAVRRALEQLSVPCPVSYAAYSELCELATHVTPETRPNSHNPQDDCLGYVGGNPDDFFGCDIALNKLILYCSLSSMVISNIMGLRSNVEYLAELGHGTFSA